MNDAVTNPNPTEPALTTPVTPDTSTEQPVSAAGGTLLGAQPEPAPAPVEPPKADAPAGFAVTDLTLPEGLTAEDPALAQFVTEMNEAKVPKEASQKLLDQHYKAMKDAQEAGAKLYADMNKKWADEVRADPEIGGEKLPATLASIAKVVDRFGGDQLRAALDLTGAGNHPAVVKAFAQIGAALNESGNAVQGGPVTQTKPTMGAAALYPHLAQGN